MRLLKAGLVAVLLSLGLTAPAIAGRIEDATAAYDRGDYATALQLIRPLAEQGNAIAQYSLGVFYDTGRGVQQDYAEAAKWYRKAADQGEAAAQANLGNMYYNGQGVPRDYAEAAKWTRKAADQGNADAQAGLGGLYYQGRGVPQDYAEALRLLRPLAERGNADAQIKLGIMYEDGNGVPQDYVQAHMWLNLAVAGLPASETSIRNAAVIVRDGVAAKMTPDQIAQAQALAAAWKPTTGQ